MPVSQGDNYALQSLLAEHPPFKIWRGRNIVSGESCLVKVLHNDGSPEAQATSNLVSASAQRHFLIRNRHIVTARRISTQNGNLVLEYPFLEGTDWRPLTPELLSEHWPEIIQQLAVMVDFLHLRGLVHGDLKLENFLVAERAGTFDLRMIDLDFLQFDNAKPLGLVFGTPGHIAPELLANERAMAQSDNYSLGVSLRALLTIDSRGDRAPVFDRSKLEAMITELSAEDYVLRPRFLLDSLVRHGLVSKEVYAQSHHQLLAMQAAAQFAVKARRALRSGNFERVLTTELRLFGIAPEFLAASRSAAKCSLSKTIRVWRKVIGNGRLERQGEFFHLQLSDLLVDEIMDGLDAITGRPDANTKVATAEEALLSARLFRAQREPLRGLRLLKRYLTEDPLPQKAMLLREAAECTLAANHQSVAADYLVEAYRADNSASRFRHLVDAQVAALRSGGKEAALRIASVAAADPEYAANEPIALEFQRVDAWLMLMDGKLDEAEVRGHQIEKRTVELGLHELQVLTVYMLGVIAWRRGDIAPALKRFESALSLADSYSLPHKKAAPLISMSQILVEEGRYIESISRGKQGRQIALRSDQASVLTTALNAVIISYARLNKPAKAAYWLQQRIVELQGVPSGMSPAMSLAYRAILARCEGKIEDSRADQLRVLDLLRGAPESQISQRAWMCLGELAMWQRDTDNARAYFERARTIAHQISDHEARIECEAYLLMNLRKPTSDELAQLTQKTIELFNCRQTNRAVEASLSLLIYGSILPEAIVGSIRALRDLRGYQRCPLYAAATALVGDGGDDPAEILGDSRRWIRAYQHLSTGRMYFYAMLAATKVAENYESHGSFKRARNYLLQAQRHARTIGNQPMVQELETRVAGLEIAAGSERSWIDSLLAVSDLMKGLGDYRPLLDRLLRFAVDQTGAERGIIFLRRPDRSGLRPVTAYNCDEQSVKELSDFSSSIPLDALKEGMPFFIDDAVRDSRTNKYQSVVAHNIMSVACIPLILEGSPFGVLYLDHHALPALFGEEDRKLMSAIANLLVVTISKSKELRIAIEQVGQLRSRLDSQGITGSFVTHDPRMLELLRSLPKIAASSATVLILGETGTGKEVLCDLIHQQSPRFKESFLKLNCASLSPTLLESELFGIAANVATNVREREGKFEAADGGTMFLDEIADMPLDAQAKVLRVVEQLKFERVGSTRVTSVDIRFIFATHRDLDTMVAEGTFRRDLYHRISTVVLEIPPLRERREDIPLLIEHFLSLYSAQKLPPRFNSEVYDILIRHPWPGNVRQLRSVIENLCLLYGGEEVTPSQLPTKILRERETTSNAGQDADAAEKARIIAALRQTKGNQSQAAKLVQMSLSTFRRRMKYFGLS